MGSLGGGGASITSATGALGAGVGLVLRGTSSASDSSGGVGGLVFVSEEVASVGMWSPFASSGVFDRGGGVGFPLSSGLTTADVAAAVTLSPLAWTTAVLSDPDMADCGGVGVEPLRPPDIISSVISRPPWLGSLILICFRSRLVWMCCGG